MPQSLFDLLLDLRDLDQLVASELRESDTLEYKTASGPVSPNEYKELAKDVSAFANSAGGVLIYGIATDRSDKTKPIARVPIDVTLVDTILQVIATHIRNPIPGLRWKTLPVAGTVEALIFDVPASPIAPHQVSVRDYRYYRRHGPISEPMSHDLLELYFGRRLGPFLEPNFSLTRISNEDHGDMLGRFRLHVSATNIGQRIARFPLFLATAVDTNDIIIEDGPHYGRRFVNPNGKTVSFGAYLADEVIHPELATSFFECRLTFNRNLIGQEELPLFFFGFHADRMKRVGGRAYLKSDADEAVELIIAPDES